MTNFELYAAYYDLLYEDKRYGDEAAFVAQLIRDHAPGARSILELGCGTGKHALELAQRGFSITGIDRSSGMVAAANARFPDTGLPADVTVKFDLGDVRTARLGGTFDAVVSLFHVMSYQVTDSDLMATIRTAAEHLADGGVFIFDCWYGPAVLSARPEVRVRRGENSQLSVFRVAEPVMDPKRNVVDVHYTIWIEQKPSGAISVVREVHPMRYLFVPEIETMLASAGFRLHHACEWMTSKTLDCSTWSATFVAIKR